MLRLPRSIHLQPFAAFLIAPQHAAYRTFFFYNTHPLMSFTRSKAAWVLTAAFTACGAIAACPSNDPAAIAQSFYTHHYNFYHGNPAGIKHLVTPRLFSALQSEYRCPRGELCAIDSDPWLDAQDGKIAPPITFMPLSHSGTEAKVLMTYSFVLDTERRPQHVTLILNRPTPSACLLVSDLVSPGGQSLVRHIENWHKKARKPF